MFCSVFLRWQDHTDWEGVMGVNCVQFPKQILEHNLGVQLVTILCKTVNIIFEQKNQVFGMSVPCCYCELLKTQKKKYSLVNRLSNITRLGIIQYWGVFLVRVLGFRVAGTGIGYFFKNFHTHSGTGIRFKANFCLVQTWHWYWYTQGNVTGMFFNTSTHTSTIYSGYTLYINTTLVLPDNIYIHLCVCVCTTTIQQSSCCCTTSQQNL